MGLKKQKVTENNRVKLGKLHKTKHQKMNENFSQVVQRGNYAKHEHQLGFKQKFKEDLDEIEQRQQRKIARDRNASMAHQHNFMNHTSQDFGSQLGLSPAKASSQSPAIAVRDYGEVEQTLKQCELKIKKGFDNSMMMKQQKAQRAKDCQIAPNIEELRRRANEENNLAWEKYLLK